MTWMDGFAVAGFLSDGIVSDWALRAGNSAKDARIQVYQGVCKKTLGRDGCQLGQRLLLESA